MTEPIPPTSPNNPTPPKKPDPKPKPSPKPLTIEQKKMLDNVAQLQALVEGMSDEERDRLAGLGINIPRGDIEHAVRGQYKFGVRCTNCNKVALYFVGDEWQMEDGSIETLPPALPHSAINWTQSLPASQIDRNRPRCQYCGVDVPTEGHGGAFRRDHGRIVEIAMFEGARDKAYDRKGLREFKRARDTGGGGVIDISSSYSLAQRKTSDVIEEQRGEGAKQEIEFLAEATGVADQLRDGFKK